MPSSDNNSNKQIRLIDDSCFQQAMIFGILSGIAFVLHKNININTIKKYNRNAMKPITVPRKESNIQFSVAFFAASCISFSTCRIVKKTKSEKLKQSFDKIRRFNDKG